MSAERFFVSDTNPNVTCGGGGCVCDPGAVSDCSGPFVIFPGPETDNILSPHVVIGAPCLRAAAKAIDGEILSAGEDAVDSTAELVDEEIVPEV
jgi:hypothetical protein